MRMAIGLASLIGGLLFGLVFAMSFGRPALVEDWLQAAIRQQVERSVSEKLAELERTPVVQFANRLLQQNSEELARLRELQQQLQQKVQQRLQPLIDEVVREMRDPASESRRTLADWGDESLKLRLAELSSQGRRVTDFIRAKYDEAAAALLREFRIFSAANALVFLLGAAVLLRRRRGAWLLPSMALLGAALAVNALFLLRQEWLRFLVFGA